MKREQVQTIHGNMVLKDTCYIEYEYTYTYSVEGATYTNTYKSLIAPVIEEDQIGEGRPQYCGRPFRNCKIIGVTKRRMCTTGGVTVEMY